MGNPESVPLLPPQPAPREVQGKGAAQYLDFAEAERLAEESVARDVNGERFPLSTPISQLGSLGTGVGLYLHFVTYAGYALAFMSIVTLPVLISNLHGSIAFDPAEKISFPRNLIVASSLGNHPESEPLILHSVMDFVCTLSFFAFLVYFRRQQLLARKEIETKHITASDYSVAVSHIPEDATEDEVAEYFAKYGEVENVTLCTRGYSAIARLMELKGKAEEDVEQFEMQMSSPEEFPDAPAAHAEAVKLLDRLAQELARLRRAQANATCCGHAFVTFTLESAACKCVGDFKPTGFFGLWATVRPQSDLFRLTTNLHVRVAPQPSDIIWGNIEVGAKSRALRTLGTSAVALLLLLIATGLIAAVNGKHFFLGNIGFVLGGLVNVFSVLVIIISNVSMFVIVPILSEYEAHVTHSTREVHIMLRLWAFQVLNTMIAAGMFWDSSKNTTGQTNWAHWFADGGFFFLNVILGDSVLMNVIEYLRPFDLMLPRRLQGPKCMTQKRLNCVYQAPELSLGMRYQMILKHFTLVLALGSAMPLNYWLITVFCVVTFWIDKYNLLRMYRKPANLSDEVANVAAVYVAPLSLLLHLALAPYFYTVVVSCPTEPMCTGPISPLLTPTYLLLAVAAGIVTLLWQPLLHREPEVEYDMVRAREVPYSCVAGIENYDPPHAAGGDGDTWAGTGSGGGTGARAASRERSQSRGRKKRRDGDEEGEGGEIGISVF